jgi:succinate dehydrogenase / fumarate reductase flavoprotein subunit
VFYLSTNAKNSNVTAAWRCHKRGAAFANPCYVQIHPTCIPVSGDYQSKLTLMSESLRNDGRVWVPKKKGDERPPNQIPEDERYYYLEEKYPSFGNLVPRDVASRNAKIVCDDGMGVGPTGRAVYLDFRDAIKRDGKKTIEEKYGNLFEMYENITGDSPYEVPMRIFPAVHYTMGGLWVDYNLMSSIPGLFVAGEANFSDHGANRLGASALMQGLSDGYFIIPYTIGNYLAKNEIASADTKHDAFDEAAQNAQGHIDKLLNVKGDKSVVEYHRELGQIMWDKVGIARNEEGLKKAIKQIRELREDFWQNVRVPGEAANYNKYLEFAGRVADFLELGELMAEDALHRDESAGCHLREEHQTEEGEALRNDEEFSYVAAWEFKGLNGQLEEELHKEDLEFEFVELKQRSYK